MRIIKRSDTNEKISYIITAIFIIAVAFMGCGKSFECYLCEKNATTAYYDIDGDFICKNCAKTYWLPFDYKDYKAN